MRALLPQVELRGAGSAAQWHVQGAHFTRGCPRAPPSPSRPPVRSCVQVRQLKASSKLAAAAGGDQLRVLPLHGSLPAAHQSRVFERWGPALPQQPAAQSALAWRSDQLGLLA